MTTIAVNRKMMAADSKVAIADQGGGIAFSYPAKKIFRTKAGIIGAAGDSGLCSQFIEWAKTGFKPSARPLFRTVAQEEGTLFALVLTPDGIDFFDPSYPEPERIEADFFAIGSGAAAARVAMMLGADPPWAVELACAVDDNSGPPIQVLALGKDE